MLPAYENKMISLGLDPTNDTLIGNSPAAVGNRIAQAYIQFGLADSSNEMNDYENLVYEPINPALFPEEPGNPDLTYPNRWQPLGFEEFVDQSGNVIEGGIPPFLSPEWGAVVPFSLQPTSAPSTNAMVQIGLCIWILDLRLFWIPLENWNTSKALSKF